MPAQTLWRGSHDDWDPSSPARVVGRQQLSVGSHQVPYVKLSTRAYTKESIEESVSRVEETMEKSPPRSGQGEKKAASRSTHLFDFVTACKEMLPLIMKRWFLVFFSSRLSSRNAGRICDFIRERDECFAQTQEDRQPAEK